MEEHAIENFDALTWHLMMFTVKAVVLTL